VSKTDRKAGWQKSPLTRRIDLTEIKERLLRDGARIVKKQTPSSSREEKRKIERERERQGEGERKYREIHN